jgi:hypothetical protein
VVLADCAIAAVLVGVVAYALLDLWRWRRIIRAWRKQETWSRRWAEEWNVTRSDEGD